LAEGMVPVFAPWVLSHTKTVDSCRHHLSLSLSLSLSPIRLRITNNGLNPSP
jgi:hypothetical protein